MRTSHVTRRCLTAVWLLAGLLAGNPPAHALDTAPLASVELKDALAAARLQHPRLKAATSRVAAQQAGTLVPVARLLPKVGTTVQGVFGTNNNTAAIWLGSEGAVEFPRIAGTGFLQHPGEINWRPYPNTVVALGAEQKLFDAGRVVADLVRVDAQTDAARAARSQAVLQVDQGVVDAFYAVVGNQAVLGAARLTLERAQVLESGSRALVSQGLRPGFDVDRAVAEVARSQSLVEQAEAALLQAQAGLAVAMGQDGGRVDAVAPAPSTSAALPAMEDAAVHALARHPQLKQASALRRADTAHIYAEATEALPQVKLVGAAFTSAGGAPADGHLYPTFGSGVLPWIPDYYGGVVMSWKMLEPVTAAHVYQAVRERDVAAAEVAEAEHAVRARVELAWRELQARTVVLPGLEKANTLAQLNAVQATTRFQAGVATTLDVMDANQQQANAEVQLALAKIAVERARILLTIAMGDEP